jgi:hypothetical protein
MDMMNRRLFVHAVAAAPVLVAATRAASAAPRGDAPMPTDNDGRHDFDFFHGRWRIQNQRLAKRLAGSTEWQEFEAICECWKTISNCGMRRKIGRGRCGREAALHAAPPCPMLHRNNPPDHALYQPGLSLTGVSSPPRR